MNVLEKSIIVEIHLVVQLYRWAERVLHHKAKASTELRRCGHRGGTDEPSFEIRLSGCHRVMPSGKKIMSRSS